ncbi:RES family NAD+ phosphorylase [Oceanitalea stevensii]|uniref:RES family NAD+ phosphorylase n=1 Tax=Oceanitalea stevensii TaxID=2763072 RepID=UPI002044D581|nr:RES family NAD+ phosphorylase [Oceanitalea stevensii]
MTWLRDDWRLFGHPTMDDAHAKELLADILDDGEIVRADFVPDERFESESLKQWDDLRDEMMHRNRWFLDEPIDLERLKLLLDLLIASHEQLADTWFRARLLADDTLYGIDEMGAPPHRLAGHGRANPAGIRYLYLGSEPATAVSEIRPHTGEFACVATFNVPQIRAVDLRDPRAQVSPFILSDADEISQLRADLPLLERLGDELTKPVLPRGAAFEYTPSQYLCEYIKKCGFDGVLYRSSVSNGVNLALFDPGAAEAVEVTVHHVEQVSVATKANVGSGWHTATE